MMEPTIHYTSASHADSVLMSVNKMRLDEELCDVVVVVGNIRIQAHGVILAASVPLFSQMSMSSLEYKLEDVDETAVLKVIEFCYTSSISINEEDLWPIFIAATKLGCKEITDFCCELLISSLDLTTCVQTHLVAAALNCDNLKMVTVKFIAENIDVLCVNDTFLCLTSHEILELVASLHVKDDQLLKLINAWLDHDVQGRMKIVLQLLEDIPSFANNLQKYLVSDMPSDKPQSVTVRQKDDGHDHLQLSPGRGSEIEYSSLSTIRHSQQQLLREVPLFMCMSCGEAFDCQSQLGQHVQKCGESVHARMNMMDNPFMQSADKVAYVCDDPKMSPEDVATSCEHLVSKCRLGTNMDKGVSTVNQIFHKGDDQLKHGNSKFCHQRPSLQSSQEHSQYYSSKHASLALKQHIFLGDVPDDLMAKQSVTTNQHKTGSNWLDSVKCHLPYTSENKHSREILCQNSQRLSQVFASSSNIIESQCPSLSKEQTSSTSFTRIMKFGSRKGMNNSNSYKTEAQAGHELAENSVVNQECETKFGQTYRDGIMKCTAIDYPENKVKVHQYPWKYGLSQAKFQNILISRRKLSPLKLKCHVCNQAFSERMMLVNHKKLVHGFMEDTSSEDSYTISEDHYAIHQYRNKKRHRKGSFLANISGHRKENFGMERSSDRQYHLAGSEDNTAKKNSSALAAESCSRKYSDFTDCSLELEHDFCQICAAFHVKDSPCHHTMEVCKHDQNEADKGEIGMETGYDKNAAICIADDPLDMSKNSQRVSTIIHSSMSKSHHAPLDLTKYCTNHNHSVAAETGSLSDHSTISVLGLVSHDVPKNVTSDFLYNHYPVNDSITSDLAMYEPVVGEREISGKCIYQPKSESDLTNSCSGNNVYSLSEKKVSSQQGFPCAACKRVFTYQAALLTHMRTHSLSAHTYQCQLCKQSFTSVPDLKAHVCPNGVERPYACPNCDQMFAKNIHLKRHLATHSGLKPYPCWVCGKRFSRSDHLKRHTQSLHAGSRPHGCLICGKEFVRKYELNKHMMAHSGDVNPNLLITSPFPTPSNTSVLEIV